MTGMTLYDKLWSSHVIKDYSDGASLLHIDRHLVHEVSSPQAFAGLRRNGRKVRHPAASLAVADHAVPTFGRDRPIADQQARSQVETLIENTREFGIPYIPLSDATQGIVHVIGPELGFTQPGISLACGDSHTCTHGAFGALAFGIGSSESESILTVQAIRQTHAKAMNIRIDGALAPGVFAKDVILAIIGRIGTSGGIGYAIEYSGSLIESLSMEARMTICNMTIESGSRVGLIAPDDTTFRYIEGRPMSPKGAMWGKALDYYRTLPSDLEAVFERSVAISAADLAPQVTWGTSPEDVLPVTGRIPSPDDAADGPARERYRKMLAYMDLTPGTALEDIAIDRVFIGSCTNGRIEDLRAAASVIQGRKVSPRLSAMVVPGSSIVKRQAEDEGLDDIFRAAGFEWRDAGCSMCVAMNTDRLTPGQRCASTSNRNFEGRQGPGGRTHLMSPAMAAAAAITGHIADVRQLMQAG